MVLAIRWSGGGFSDFDYHPITIETIQRWYRSLRRNFGVGVGLVGWFSLNSK